MLLKLSDVGYCVGQNRLISDISFELGADEMLSIIGPNGAGKSTLMKLILGLLKPTSGQIVRDKNLRMGYVPQRFSVAPILPLRVQDLLDQQANHRLSQSESDFIYDNLSLKNLLKKQVHYLSGGEMQRVLLARALLDKPNLLILDEPMQGLDPDAQAWLYQFIDELPGFLRCAMLVVSHDLHWVMRGSRRVLCLNKHICCQGVPSELAVSDEFRRLFGHYHEQPYIHQPHHCHHDG